MPGPGVRNALFHCIMHTLAEGVGIAILIGLGSCKYVSRQEKKAVQSPVVGNLARKMIACQKKKTRDEYGVSVLRFFAGDMAHGRNNKVPVPVR